MRTRFPRSTLDSHASSITRRDVLAGAFGLGVGMCISNDVLSQTAPAAFDFYISPTGSNSNAGTQASPWALSALSSKPVIAGKRVGLLDGTYVITGTGTGNGGYIQAISYGGTASSPTVVEAVNPRGAIITTNNNGTYPQATAMALGAVAANTTIRNIRFQQMSFGAVLAAANNIRIEGCDIFDCDLNRYSSYVAQYPGDNIGAIRTDNDASGLVISNCRIERVRNGQANNHNAACLGPFFHFSNITVENCTLLDAPVGVYFKNFCSGITVRNCYMGGGMSLGLYGFMYYSSTKPKLPSIAYNNIFNRVNQILDGDMADTAADVSFYNNTVIAGPDAATYSTLVSFSNPQGSSALYQARFFNNIWHFPSSISSVYTFRSNSAPPNQVFVVLDYSSYPLSGFNVSGLSSSVGTLSTWTGITGKDLSSFQTSDPRFVNANGSTPEDFKLQSTSPLKDKGRVGGIASGSTIDVGAWGGATSIGHNFGPKPIAPLLQVS